MTVTADRYANWKAPPDDGQILIWPEPAALLAQTTDNARLLSEASDVRIQNLCLPELRRAQRHWLGHTQDDQPILATGHQTELYHGGVWAKDVLLSAAAAKVGGQGYHLAVDTDQPKHLNVRWPGASIPLTDGPGASSAAWCGLLDAPTPSHLEILKQQSSAIEAEWHFKPMLGDVLDSLRRLSLEAPKLAVALTNAGHELDWQLGLRHHAMVVSPLLFSEPYLAFAHHILSAPDRFASDYNTSLAEYRTDNGITSSTRPMPDLHVDSDKVEVPFWLDDLANATRTRATVTRTSQGWALALGDDSFDLDATADGWNAARALAGWLRRTQLRLSPRALTLTTFLRLLIADQFVHGIGGARYDQVTDRLIAHHFKLAPPWFAVTTATLYFPGAVGRSRSCVSCLAQEGHRLKHSLLGEGKRQILRQLNALPRRSLQRSIAFHNMHGALSAASVGSTRMRDWAQRYRDAEQLDRQDEVVFDRELFYAMQTRERLAEMIERYGTALS